MDLVCNSNDFFGGKQSNCHTLITDLSHGGSQVVGKVQIKNKKEILKNSCH